MPNRREKEREELDRKTAAFLESGGEITTLKNTDRKEVVKLSNQANKMISYPGFMQGFME